MTKKQRMIKSKKALTTDYYYRGVHETKHLYRIARQVSFSPPTTPILDDCGAVNKMWRPHINGVLDVLLEDDVWLGGTENIEWAKAQVLYLMEALYKCKSDNEDDKMILRQNPNNPCQLEQMVDGQWTLAFDYSLCIAPQLQKLNDNLLIDLKEAIEGINIEIETALETDPPQTVFPDTDNDISDPNNADKNKLLCAVIWDYVLRTRSYLNALQSEKQGSEATTLSDVFNAGGQVVASGISFAISIASPLPIKILTWLARGGSGVNFAIQSSRALETTQNYMAGLWQSSIAEGDLYQIPLNSDGLQEIACALFEGLKDKPITRANFDTALENIQLSDNVLQTVRNAYILALGQTLMFNEFLAVYQEAYTAFSTGQTDIPVLGNCECDDAPVYSAWDFWFEFLEVVPPTLNYYESFPRENAPTPLPIETGEWLESPSYQENYWFPTYIVYSEESNLPVTLQWSRGTVNSGWAYIEIFDGVNWVKVTANQNVGLGGVIGQIYTLHWSNPLGLTYWGVRGVVNHVKGYMVRFKSGSV